MNKSSESNIVSIILLGVFYFIFGFVTWLNGSLIPYLKIACELKTDFQAYFVAFAFYIAYFVTALPSSWILNKTGFKNGMMLGLLVMALGAVLFLPAAYTRSYILFLVALFVIGTGLSILQTAVNPYITIVGPIESAAKRISIMGICNKIAGVLAPLVLGAVILHNADQLVEELKVLDEVQRKLRLDALAQRVVVPYSIMAAILSGLAVFVRYSPLPEVEAEAGDGEEIKSADSRTSVLQYPNLVLGVIALFCYVGAEVITGDLITPFGQSEGIPLNEAKIFPAFPLAAMVVGYLIGIATIPKIISQSAALVASAIGGLVFSLLALFTHGYTAVLFISLLGLANALVWPAIWPLAISGLGKFTKTGSALLIMAIAGGALLPLVYGSLSLEPSIGKHNAYWIMIPLYGVILYYSLKGYKITRW